MITLSVFCALIIYLFGGYLDSANEHGIARAVEKIRHTLTNKRN